MPWLVLVGAATLWLAPVAEAMLVGGDLRGWLATTLGLDYAARNAMVVGLAMGFAVIPGIYALAEDALAGGARQPRRGCPERWGPRAGRRSGR